MIDSDLFVLANSSKEDVLVNLVIVKYPSYQVCLLSLRFTLYLFDSFVSASWDDIHFALEKDIENDYRVFSSQNCLYLLLEK